MQAFEMDDGGDKEKGEEGRYLWPVIVALVGDSGDGTVEGNGDEVGGEVGKQGAGRYKSFEEVLELATRYQDQ